MKYILNLINNHAIYRIFQHWIIVYETKKSKEMIPTKIIEMLDDADQIDDQIDVVTSFSKI